MESIGKYLKEVRESKNISLKKAAKETKISLEHLEQIENDQFNLISGSTYIKGFLRTYGEYLKLDGNVLVTEYLKEHQNVEDDKAGLPLSQYQRMELSVVDWMPAAKKIFITTILLLAIIATVKYWPKLKEPWQKISSFKLAKKENKKIEKKNDILTDIENIEKKSTQKKKIQIQTSPAVSANNAAEKEQETAATENMKLSIQAKKSVWITLKIDGRVILEDILKEGDQETWFGQKSFEIKVSRPQHVAIFYNDNLIEALTQYQSPKIIKIANDKVNIHD